MMLTHHWCLNETLKALLGSAHLAKLIVIDFFSLLLGQSLCCFTPFPCMQG